LLPAGPLTQDAKFGDGMRGRLQIAECVAHEHAERRARQAQNACGQGDQRRTFMIVVADEHMCPESTTIMEQGPRTKINLPIDRLRAFADARWS
jgi:hypothetical protein